MASNILYQNNGGIKVDNTGNNIAVDYPIDISEGDCLILCCWLEDNTYNWNTPSGWTKETSGDGGDGNWTWIVLTKLADGTETGTQEVTVSGSSSLYKFGIMYKFNVDVGYTWDQTYKNVDGVCHVHTNTCNINQGQNTSGYDGLAVAISMQITNNTMSLTGSSGYSSSSNLSSATGVGCRVVLMTQSVDVGNFDGDADFNPASLIENMGVGLQIWAQRVPRNRFHIT